MRLFIVSILVMLATGGGSHAADLRSAPLSRVPFSQARNAYFGDLHLHTAYSFDAHLLFGVQTTPDQAYRFARGEAMPYEGRQIQRKWPLDFLAVTEHSENLGVMNELDNPDSAFSKTPFGQRLRAEGKDALWSVVKIIADGKRRPPFDPKAAAAAWQMEIDTANRNYIPGVFTTLLGYEWSPEIGNKSPHRVVVFGGDSAPFPFSALDSQKPEDLWTFMEAQRRNGVSVLAITCHPSLGGGLSYEWNDNDDTDFARDYARRRAANEPLSEIASSSQSEVHPSLSPNDPFANFELREKLLIDDAKGDPHGSYVREALGRGVALQQKLGVNPFKFGMTGVSDNHTGFTVSDEDADFDDRSTTSKSLTGVWAEQNTREAIFNALQRRETFATTGTRMKVRFFGGWSYSNTILKDSHWIEKSYAGGVTMGSDLVAKPRAAQSPRFVIWAAKDSDGANLDRVQIIKLWAKNGAYAEKIFDVAASGGRKALNGVLPNVGNTVDLKAATYANTIGAKTLSTVWEDPEFDPAVAAAYYLRVLEIPTPRRSTIMAVKARTPLPPDVPAAIQERAWSSPIWYTPGS